MHAPEEPGEDGIARLDEGRGHEREGGGERPDEDEGRADAGGGEPR